MTGQELLTQIYYAYRGKGASKVPSWGEEKAETAIAIANRKKNEWARDPFHRWNSLWEIKSLGTIDTEVFTYNFDSELIANSDYAEVTRTDGTTIQYKVVSPQRRATISQGFYIHGINPKKLTWIGGTIDSATDGGTLKHAGYFLPADITDADDPVLVDDPNWLVYATAAELARNDAAKDDQYSNLQGMANELYNKMIANNLSTGFLQPNGIVNNMQTIGDMTEDWAGDE